MEQRSLTSTRFLDAFSHLYKRVCLSVSSSFRRSVCRLVCHTRVEFLRVGLNLNKIASETRNCAIKRWDRYATHLISDLCQTGLMICGLPRCSLKQAGDYATQSQDRFLMICDLPCCPLKQALDDACFSQSRSP